MTVGNAGVLSVVTAGVDAAINQRANNYDWPRNRGRYVRAAVREFATLKGYHYELTLDGVKLPPQRLHLVAFANTSYYGGRHAPLPRKPVPLMVRAPW